MCVCVRGGCQTQIERETSGRREGGVGIRQMEDKTREGGVGIRIEGGVGIRQMGRAGSSTHGHIEGPRHGESGIFLPTDQFLAWDTLRQDVRM
jgi:hypothetical protein